MSGTKELKTQITSIKSTQKITKAMEMVAMSRMRRTQERMARGRPYSDLIRSVIGHVAHASPEYRHTFMVEREVKRVGFIVITTDRGLCGGLNINLLKAVVNAMQEWDSKDVEIDLCLIGNKGVQFFNSYGGNVIASGSHLSETPVLSDLIGSIKVMLDAFEEGRVDKVFLANNLFVSTMTQEPVVSQLLPLNPDSDASLDHRWDYLYEPDAHDLLDGLLTRFLESQVYQAVVENVACEQAAKMIAMKAATESAGELIDELQLIMNKARQSSITQELAEIVGGAAAV